MEVGYLFWGGYSKAKNAQDKKIAQVAKLQKDLANVQTQLIKVLSSEVNRLQSVSVAKVMQSVPAPSPLKATALANVNAQAGQSVGKISTAPTKPAPFVGSVQSIANIAAGIKLPSIDFGDNLSKGQRNLITASTATHISLTACGFEPTVFGAACGVADGVLYLFEGEWGSAGLSVFSAVPFVGFAADSGKAAKLALRVAEEGRVAKVGLKLGENIDGLGTVIQNVPGKVLGFTAHGAERLTERGITEQVVQKAVTEPLVVLRQVGNTTFYLNHEVAVILNDSGQVVTTYSKSEFYPKVLSLLQKLKQ